MIGYDDKEHKRIQKVRSSLRKINNLSAPSHVKIASEDQSKIFLEFYNTKPKY